MRARTLLSDLAEGRAPWAIPWPCVYEFLRLVTHPRVFHPPMPSDSAGCGEPRELTLQRVDLCEIAAGVVIAARSCRCCSGAVVMRLRARIRATVRSSRAAVISTA